MSAPIEVLITSDVSGQMWNACVWDLQSGTSLLSYKGASSSPHGMCLLGNQYLLGAVANKPLIHVWALQRRDQQQMKIVCPGKVTALAVSPDGAYCVGAVGEKIHVWQVCSGNLMAVLTRHYQDVNVLKFTDDGSHFLSGGEDNLVIVWSLTQVLATCGDRSRKAEPQKIFTSHSLPVTDVHVGRGGNRARAVSSSLDQTCKIWDLVSGELLSTLVFPVSILSVTMDTSEFKMFAGGSNGDIFAVNMYGEPIKTERHIEAENKSVIRYKGHSRQVSCLAVSMDGRRLVSGSHDLSVKIWDIFSGQCINTISHKGAVTNVLVVPTPPSIADPKLKPTLPIHQFKRYLYTPGGDNPDEEMETLEMRITSDVDTETKDSSCLLLQSDTSNTSGFQPVAVERFEDKYFKIKEDLERVKSLNKDLYKYAVSDIVFGNSNK